MRPCQHNAKTKADLWHYPKGSPALELARLCPDCVAREQRAGVAFFTAAGVPVLSAPLLPAPSPSTPPKEATVPRSKPVEITCADCGKVARLKAHGRCSRCYEIDRCRKAAAAMAAADKAGPRPVGLASSPPPAPDYSLPSLGERALAAFLLLHCESLGAAGKAPRLQAVLEAVLDGKRGVLGMHGGAP